MRFAAVLSAMLAFAYMFAAFVAWDALWLFHMGGLTVKDRADIGFSIAATVVVCAVFAMMIEVS